MGLLRTPFLEVSMPIQKHIGIHCVMMEKFEDAAASQPHWRQESGSKDSFGVGRPSCRGLLRCFVWQVIVNWSYK